MRRREEKISFLDPGNSADRRSRRRIPVLLQGPEAAVKYRTVKAERGGLSAFVTANGTINPVITVLVGSQVSGTIQKLYADYNSRVKKDQLIAQIDPAIFQAQVSQAKAKLENAKAAFLNAQADIATAGPTSNPIKPM